MNMNKALTLVIVAGSLMMVGQARATIVAAFGSDGKGTGLQTKLNPLVTTATVGLDTWDSGDSNLGSPKDYINGTVQNGQSALDVLWNLAGVGSSATIVLEIAGYSGANTFGFYDSTDASKKAELFDGSDSSSDKLFVRFNGTQLQSSLNNKKWRDVSGGAFGSTTFGMYLEGPGGTFYSDPFLNGGNDNLVAYQGFGDSDSGRKLKIGSKQVAWDENSYVLGWEDLVLSSSDKDYQDMVLLVSQITPYAPAPIAVVPEASTVIAGSLLLLPLGASMIRILRKNRAV